MSNSKNTAEAAAAEFEKRTGLEYMQWVVENEFWFPFGKLLNMRVVAVGEGWAEIEARPTFEHYNMMNRVHGGYTATLVDTSLGSAVHTKTPKGQGAGTVQLNVNYTGKIDADSAPLLAKAQVIHSGRFTLTAETKVTDRHGKVVAHGTGTFMIYPK